LKQTFIFRFDVMRNESLEWGVRNPVLETVQKQYCCCSHVNR